MKHIELRDKDLAVLRGTFSRFPSVREVRVFGSRATGDARRASDLDLAVFAPDATAEEWADLCEALESTPIIYELDVVRAEQTSNARLREKIEGEGVTVYPEEKSSKIKG
ncbi:MAG: nucleotidyltransferase domain-containing protein [Acidobacteriota bacterium]|nr:nucleotidyltransferase domain-containing protein [Acidobacteriota bacterium]